MANNEPIICKLLPFYSLTNCQLEYELNTTRRNIGNRLKDATLSNYMKNIMVDNSPQKECMNCEYYDDEQFVRLAKCGNPNIGIIHMNIRKFSKHRGEFYAYLKSLQHDFDIIVLSEIGSDASFYLSTILHDYNCLYELPKENNYGGVAIYVRQELSVSERSDLKLNKTCKCSKCNFESVWINVMKNNQSYTIGGIYRHPGGNTAHFNLAVEVALKKLDKNETCIMTGDININLLNIEGAITTDYLSSVLSYGFIPYITRPTRITEYTDTLIDHIFLRLPVRKMTTPVNSGVLFNDITDHLPVFLLLHDENQNGKREISRPKTRIFSESNIQKFVDIISSTNWCEILNHESGDLNCTLFYEYMSRFYSESFPLVTISRNRQNDRPWVTQAVVTSIRQKNKLYRKSVEKPVESNTVKYKEYKKILNVVLKAAEENYYHQLLDERSNSAKNLWKHFGPILNTSKHTEAI